MVLFAEGARIRKSSQRDGERHFDFLNESAWPACATLRDCINRWVSDFDTGDQKKIISQLTAGDSQFRHTILELVVSAMLRSLKFTVGSHPKLAHSDNTPDFTISNSSCNGYVEVTTINPSDGSQRAANREAILLRAIDSIKLPPGFILAYDAKRIGSNSINAGKITNEISRWVGEEAARVQEQTVRHFVEADWKFEICLIKTGANRIYNRAIGLRSGYAGWIQTASELRAALMRKRRRYGDLNAPFLLVVGDSKGVTWGRKEISEELVAALFGSEVISWSAEIDPQLAQAKDGFWVGPNGRRNSDVSAVLFFPDIGVFGLRNELHLPQLVVNPWASHPVPSALTALPRIELEAGKLTFRDGVSVADLIGLPNNWPGPSGV